MHNVAQADQESDSPPMIQPPQIWGHSNGIMIIMMGFWGFRGSKPHAERP